MHKIAVQINNLQKIYHNGLEAVKNINLCIYQGDFFALLGPNGAGKTTIIGMLSSLVKKTAGTITIMGHDLDQDPVAAKSQIGVVPQELNFHGFEKVIDVLLNQAAYYGVPRKIAKQRAQELLTTVGLLDRQNLKIIQLSGGMKRRVMIARALIHQPSILILDEPTAGVDIEIRQTMWENLIRLNEQGLTIILTTHYLEEAEQLCKHIAIIDHGSIIENTSMRELLATLDKELLVLYLKKSIEHVPSELSYKASLIDPSTLEIELNKGESISDVLAELEKHQIVVERLRNKSNRLEQLFLNLVNRNK